MRKARELERMVVREEQKAQSVAAVLAAEEAHGADRIAVMLLDDGGCIIVKRPASGHYKRYRDRADTKFESTFNFVAPCVVHPDRAAFDRLVDAQEGLLDSLLGHVLRLVGFHAQELLGK